MSHLSVACSENGTGTRKVAKVRGPIVLYPEKGECADPVNEGAILGKGGPSPHSRDRERQLAPDIGRGET
jgi:hypothetical protein